MRWSSVSLAATWFLVALAGCLGGSPSEDPSLGTGSESAAIEGLVVDPEAVPVGAVNVSVGEQGPETTTDVDGTFRLSHLAPGLYIVTASRDGYQPTAIDVQLSPGETAQLQFELTPVAADVPYFTTEVHVSVIACGVGTPTSRLTCGLVNTLAGQNLTDDSSVFEFWIDGDGLASVLVETTWESTQAFARELSVNILGKEGDQTNCISTPCYAEVVGPSPIRFSLIPGETWVDEDPYQPFPGDPGTGFNAYLMPPFGTTTNNAVTVFLDQQVESYVTFFHNRPGGASFTALPDQ